MQPRSRNRRRLRNTLEFERKFKLQQVGRVAAFSSVYVAVSTAVLGFFYVQLVHPHLAGDPFFALQSGDLLAVWHELPELRRMIGVWLAGMLGLSALFATTLGLHFGHITAGPLYRLKHELERIARGEPHRTIQMRPGDAFQDVAASLNRALESLEVRAAALEARNEELEQLRENRLALQRLLAEAEADGLHTADAERVIDLVRSLRVLIGKSPPPPPGPAEPAP